MSSLSPTWQGGLLLRPTGAAAAASAWRQHGVVTVGFPWWRCRPTGPKRLMVDLARAQMASSSGHIQSCCKSVVPHGGVRSSGGVLCPMLGIHHHHPFSSIGWLEGFLYFWCEVNGGSDIIRHDLRRSQLPWLVTVA